MKKLFIPLLAVFFVLTGVDMHVCAAPNALSAAITRKAAQARTDIQTQRPAASPTSDKLDSLYGFSIINYQDFKRYNNTEKVRKMSFSILKTHIYAADVQAKYGVPDYIEQTKNIRDDVRYIYIGEEHDTPSVQKEVERIIRAVRTANPGKKILLASEFFTRDHPLINPLHVKGTRNLLDSHYAGFQELADELDMDTLSLDDNIILHNPETMESFVKVGNKLIRAEKSWLEQYLPYFEENIEEDSSKVLNDPQKNIYFAEQMTLASMLPEEVEELYAQVSQYPKLLKYAQSFGPGNEKYALCVKFLEDDTYPFALHSHPNLLAYALNDWTKLYNPVLYTLDPIHGSAWAMKQRNVEWAERIKAVEDQYDVIIVWGGYAHTSVDTQYPFTMPLLLSSSNAVEFTIRPLNSNEAALEEEEEYEEVDLEKELELDADMPEPDKKYKWTALAAAYHVHKNNFDPSSSKEVWSWWPHYLEITFTKNAIFPETEEEIARLLETEEVPLRRPLRLPQEVFQINVR